LSLGFNDPLKFLVKSITARYIYSHTKSFIPEYIITGSLISSVYCRRHV